MEGGLFSVLAFQTEFLWSGLILFSNHWIFQHVLSRLAVGLCKLASDHLVALAVHQGKERWKEKRRGPRTEIYRSLWVRKAGQRWNKNDRKRLVKSCEPGSPVSNRDIHAIRKFWSTFQWKTNINTWHWTFSWFSESIHIYHSFTERTKFYMI